MHRERLLKLADHLDTVAPQEFDIGYWKRRDLQCGTVACAVGHACTIPEFDDAGLGLCRDYTMGGGHTLHYCPHFKGLFGFEAAADFFGLPMHYAWFLFNAANYPPMPSPGDVATRIRAYVADREE